MSALYNDGPSRCRQCRWLRVRFLLGLVAQFLPQEGDFRAQAKLLPCPFSRSVRQTCVLQAELPPLSETRSKSCPFAPRELPRFNTTMSRSDSRPEPHRGLCIPLQRLDSGYLLPCPSRRASQVPWLSLEYMPSPNTPGGPTQRSCYPIAPVAGFPINLEGRHRQSCNEAESSSQMLRPILYLTLRPFPTLLDDSGYPYTPGRRFRGEQAITAGGISATRIARASPGTQVGTGAPILCRRDCSL